MATSTTNLGLIKPLGSDKIRIAQINQNSDTIDAAVGPVGSTSLQAQANALKNGMAIVSNNNTHAAITAGQYVYIYGHGTLSEGLYVATANVAANGSLSSSKVSAVSGGGLNALNSNVTALTKKVSATSYNTWSDFFTKNSTGFSSGIVAGSASDAPPSITSSCDAMQIKYSTVYGVQFAMAPASPNVYYRRYNNGTWTSWDSFLTRNDIVVSAPDQSTVSVASGTWTTIQTLQLPAGAYVITGDLNFGTSTAGIRVLILETTESQTNNVSNSILGTERADLQKTRIIVLTSTTTIYLRAYQTSGSAISVVGKIRAIRITS